MLLSEIWIYPVKSLGGMRVKEAQVEERGLKFDRRWMVVDENGKFLTQRVNANMALINVALDSQGLILSHHDEKESQVCVPYHPGNREALNVRVWKDTLTSFTVCDQVDSWLSDHLRKKVRIVEMTEESQRKIDPEMSVHGGSVSFADDFPYLLISQASLENLNNKLEVPVEMKRFRPNFVISGTEPFAEDHWKSIGIGEANFLAASLCERCLMVNIDPETGKPGANPLKTLATFRKEDKKILFGRNLISIHHGTIREGDPITVI